MSDAHLDRIKLMKAREVRATGILVRLLNEMNGGPRNGKSFQDQIKDAVLVLAGGTVD
jgi:hypothetical protein